MREDVFPICVRWSGVRSLRQMDADQTAPDRSVARRVRAFVARQREAASIQRSFDDFGRTFPWSSRAYFMTAIVWCFFSQWPTTWVEFAGAPLAVALVVQALRTPRLFAPMLGEPLLLAVCAFWAWQAVTLLWTPDLGLGLKQVGCARWVWVIVALWPVMNRRRWLIAALAAGMLAGNLSQVLHAAGTRFGVAAITWPRLPDRNSGWWDPVVGGSLLCAALGLHLPAAAFGAGRWRLVGLGGAAVSLAAIAATGTRGAWIAGAALAAIAAATGIALSRTPLRAAAVCAVLAAAMGAAAWAGAGDSISRRLRTGRDEVRAYFERGEAASDTGARLAMAAVAARAIRDHPLGGVGAGGFRSLLADGAAPAAGAPLGHGHAHNALLHAGAVSGVPGVALALAAYMIALRNARRARHGGSFNPYDQGPFWALAGLGLVSAFDTIQVNAQTAAMLTTLMALSPGVLPRALVKPPARSGAA